MPPVTDTANGEGRPAAILIAGPTASGKSGLAAALARRFQGVVINTDSMQVYADLRRLSARPSPAEEAGAPHRLYGHVDGAINYSAGHFAREATGLFAEVRRAGHLPIFVGGTGLYFRALEEGLSDLPPVPDAVRAAVRTGAEGRPTEALHADLATRDPQGAETLRPSDRAHGVPGLVAHLDGTLDRAEAIRRGQADTRRYAKRQFTWFRHQMGPDWAWTAPEAALALAEAGLTSPNGR